MGPKLKKNNGNYESKAILLQLLPSSSKNGTFFKN